MMQTGMRSGQVVDYPVRQKDGVELQTLLWQASPGDLLHVVSVLAVDLMKQELAGPGQLEVDAWCV